jgi:hypothetical protein
VTSSDPTRSRDRWQPLRELLAEVEAEIENMYVARGLHDIRTRYVHPLSAPGTESISPSRRCPFLEAEWRATEQAVAELEDEVVPHSLGQAVIAATQAQRRRSTTDRILDVLGGATPAQPLDDRKPGRQEATGQVDGPDNDEAD